MLFLGLLELIGGLLKQRTCAIARWETAHLSYRLGEATIHGELYRRAS